MKYTRKMNAALELCNKLGVGVRNLENDQVYDILEKRGYFWNAESGVWEDVKRSTSMFKDDAGLPTGTFRLRVMCDPRDLDHLLEIVNEALDTYGATISEQSNPYPNRRGPGVRVYLTGQLPAPKESED